MDLAAVFGYISLVSVLAWWFYRNLRARRIQLQLHARTWGRLSIVADMLKCSPTKAVEHLTDMFLDQRYPGVQNMTLEKERLKEEKKLEIGFTGNPTVDRFINSFIEKNQDKIAEWITRTLSSSAESPKKRQFAQALGEYLDLLPSETP